MKPGRRLTRNILLAALYFALCARAASISLRAAEDKLPLSAREKAPAALPGETSVLSLPSSNSDNTGCLACDDDCCYSPCGSAGMFFHADYLHWTVGADGFTYASVARTPLATPPEVVANETLNFDTSSGVRAGLGYRFGDGWDIGYTYTHFDNKATDTVAAGGANTALLAVDSVINTTPMASISAAATVRLDVHDIDVGWSTCLNDSFDFRAIGGVRFATIGQDLETTYTDLNFGTGTISQPINMTAAGGKLGLEGFFRANRGLHVFARGTMSFLIADLRSRQQEISAGQMVLDVQQHTARFLPVVEGSGGIGWNYGPVEIDGGYEVSTWINAFGNGNNSVDFLTRGVFARLTYSR